MKLKLAFAAAAALAFTFSTPTMAQQSGKATVSLYRAAPGHQIELLKWLAQQDRIAAAAGLAPGQLYAHTDGDSWDYMAIDPVTTPAQDAAVEAAAAKMGMATGPASNLEFRKYISMHTDTFTIGPVTAQQYLAMAGQ